MSLRPELSIIAGPNGSGKSTVADILLKQSRIEGFINADVIARGLNSQRPEQASIEAGRMMLEVLSHSIALKKSFSFESTMSGLKWKKFILDAKNSGFTVNIFFVVVDSAEIAIERVAERVRNGGHAIPESTIRRKYFRSLEMFKSHYSILVDSWWVFDNTESESKIIASKNNGDSFTSDDFRGIFNV